MVDASFLRLPFFDDRHRAFAGKLDEWASETIAPIAGAGDVDQACRNIVKLLGDGQWLRYVAPTAYGGAFATIDARTLCLARETLAYHSALADFVFAMQGLGSGPLSLFGSDALKQSYLPRVASGACVAAFALTEAEAGSDVAALQTRALADGPDHVRIIGRKAWISNGGLADFYIVFARTEDAPGARGLSAFVVDAETPGLAIEQRFEMMSPHPIATLAFDGCRVPIARRIGEAGEGFKIAMATLDLFRPTVGAAALGLARRAMDEALRHASVRKMFGGVLADLQLTQASLADMAVAIDASALLVYRAAWVKDDGAARIAREAAMAKLHATESAQIVIDKAVQLFGGKGVAKGFKVEELYRDIRALRIYEGASEIQKLIIARDLLKKSAPRPPDRPISAKGSGQ